MAYFKTNLSCTVNGVRVLQPVAYLVKYHPYYGGNNPNYDENSEMLLSFKKGSPSAALFFLRMIEKNYNSEWDDCYCIAVPSIGSNEGNSPIHKLIRRLISSHWKLRDGSGLLIRTVNPTAIKRFVTEGTTHSIDAHLSTIEVDNYGSKIIDGKKVLLINDVITTGNSVMACVAKLKDAGAKSVYVLSLALTSDDSHAGIRLSDLGETELFEEEVHVNRIQVKRLFGNIDYDIDLSNTNPVAIITAPNGRGKTTILNLLSFVLNPKYDTFQAISSIPFEEFKCFLTNNKIVELRRGRKSVLKKLLQQKERTAKSRGKKTYWDPPTGSSDFFLGNDPKGEGYLLSIYNAKNGDCIDNRIFSYDLDNEYNARIDEDDDINDSVRLRYLRYNRRRYEAELNEKFNGLTIMLSHENCNIPINFIKADRIQPVVIRSSNPRVDFVNIRQESPLERANESIAKLIQTATGKYNEAVSRAKDKLPQMFLAGEGSDLDYDAFMKGWAVYRKELDQFQEIGIITPTEDFTMGQDIYRFYKDKGDFLSTYLSAFKYTTAPLRDIYKRLALFKQILDERNAITDKKVLFKQGGISLFTPDREIKLDMLSSGEKHDFIMFYNLIFNNKNGGLVLIDEPEISLHVEWQETYLDKLLAICKMNGLQAIVATHSPNIISSHYDLLVDKGESYESE